MKAAALLRERMQEMLREIVWEDEFYKDFQSALIEELAEAIGLITFDSSGGEVIVYFGGGDASKGLKLADTTIDSVYLHSGTYPQEIPDAKATLNHIDSFIARLKKLRTELETTINEMASEKP
jgi:hypothetical protein